jgi:hypothetical protein
VTERIVEQQISQALPVEFAKLVTIVPDFRLGNGLYIKAAAWLTCVPTLK